jgi:hypothetical protein
MNFSLRVVGFDGHNFVMSDIDRTSPVDNAVACVVHRLGQRAQSAANGEKPFWSRLSDRVAFVTSEGVTVRDLSAPRAAPDNSRPAYDIAGTCGEAFAEVDSGCYESTETGWLHFLGTRQSVQVRYDGGKRGGGSGGKSWTVTARDLALRTVGELKEMLLSDAVGDGWPLSDMVIVTDGVLPPAQYQLLRASARPRASDGVMVSADHHVEPMRELRDDMKLFPLLCHTGECVLHMYRKEGVLVTVTLVPEGDIWATPRERLPGLLFRSESVTQHRVVSFTCFADESSVADVQQRLQHAFATRVVGFCDLAIDAPIHNNGDDGEADRHGHPTTSIALLPPRTMLRDVARGGPVALLAIVPHADQPRETVSQHPQQPQLVGARKSEAPQIEQSSMTPAAFYRSAAVHRTADGRRADVAMPAELRKITVRVMVTATATAAAPNPVDIVLSDDHTMNVSELVQFLRGEPNALPSRHLGPVSVCYGRRVLAHDEVIARLLPPVSSHAEHAVADCLILLRVDCIDA